MDWIAIDKMARQFWENSQDSESFLQACMKQFGWDHRQAMRNTEYITDPEFLKEKIRIREKKFMDDHYARLRKEANAGRPKRAKSSKSVKNTSKGSGKSRRAVRRS